MIAKEWQKQFASSLFNGLSETLASTLNEQDERQRQQRFAIYQNNVFYSLTQALADLYPTIKKLVGEDFFNGTAAVYIKSHPPKQAAMVYFGEDFPDFLSCFEHTQSMPYLTDVAQLELKRQQSYHAKDHDVLQADDFTKISAEAFEKSKVILSDSFYYLSSKYSVFSIWQANNNSDFSEEKISIVEPESILIVRKNYELLMFNVDAGTLRFYHGLKENHTLAEAAQLALETGDFNLPAAISLGIQQGFIRQLTQQD